MSDTKNDIQASEDAEFEVELEMEDNGQTPMPKKRRGILWLVLLLIVIALAAFAYIKLGSWLADDEPAGISIDVRLEGLERRINETNAALESRLGQITHPDYSPEINGLRRDVEDQLRLLGSLPSRMTAIRFAQPCSSERA